MNFDIREICKKSKGIFGLFKTAPRYSNDFSNPSKEYSKTGVNMDIDNESSEEYQNFLLEMGKAAYLDDDIQNMN